MQLQGMPEVTAKPAYPWYVAPFRSYRPIDLLKMLAPAILIGLVAFGMWGDPYVLLLLLLVLLITVPMQLVRTRLFKVELQQEDQLRRTLALLEETSGLQRDGDKLRWTMRHWPRWLQGRADEVAIVERSNGWLVTGSRLTMRSLAAKLAKAGNA